MRRLALLLPFVLLMLVALAVRAPLSVAVEASGARQAGLSWRAVEGTVWNGRVRGLSIQDYALGDVAVSLSPLSLLSLSPAVLLDLRGPEAEARGTLTLRAGGLEISGGSVTLRVAELKAIDPRLRARGGALDVRDLAIRTRGARCETARGLLSTDALTYGFGGAWRGPELSGVVTCADGALLMTLEGDEAGEDIRAAATLGRGAARIEAMLHSDDQDIARIAPLMGFAPYGEGWRYEWSVTR